MRVMVIVKANKDSEAGVLPSEALLTEMDDRQLMATVSLDIGRALAAG